MVTPALYGQDFQALLADIGSPVLLQGAPIKAIQMHTGTPLYPARVSIA